MKYATGIFAFALAASAQATPICVDTPQKLRDAFLTAQNNGQPNNLIEIARGSYGTGGVRFAYDASSSTTDGNLIVRGGYSADCSTQIANASLTVLDGGGTSGVLSVSAGAGSVTVEYLTIQNGKNEDGLDVGSVTGDATARFNIVRANQPNAVAAAALEIVAGGTIHVDNNLVYANTLGDGDGSVAILANGGDSFITNNTVTGNTNGNIGRPVGGVYFSYFFTSATPSAYFSNNIFWNNSDYGLYVESTALTHSHLSHDDIGTTNADTSCCANVSVAPQFVDKNGGNFHLAAASPLLGTGTTAPMGGLPLIDLDGNPRFFNGLVDLGAFERGDIIFADGLDH